MAKKSKNFLRKYSLSKLDLITPNRKLKFNMKKNVDKNRITVNFGKVYTKSSFSKMRNNVLNFGLHCTKKKNKLVGEKRKMSQEIIKTVHLFKILSIMKE